MNYLAIVVATVAAFVQSWVYYTIFGGQLQALSDAAAGASRPPAWKMLVEVARCAVLASVLAVAARRLEIDDWAGVLSTAGLAWIGFPSVLLLGAVIWENVPWRLAALHAGDWLVKLTLITAIVGLWD
jgi:hypothetical protein